MMGRHELAAAGSAVVTAADVVAGHVRLDISCLDRVYLNGYVAKLQTPGGVVYFFHDHRGKPIVSPALFEPGARQFQLEMFRTGLIRRDERQVDLGLESRRQLDLGLLRAFF